MMRLLECVVLGAASIGLVGLVALAALTIADEVEARAERDAG